jgi:hypothetical protein
MTEDARSGILDACFKMLLPLARVLLFNGIAYREFDEVCRRAFVVTASSEFGVRGRETNTSRISAMTGLPRKEVQKLRAKERDENSTATDLLSPLADLLHIWSTAPAFLNEDGSPLTLFLGAGREPSFDSLIRKSVGDVPAGAVRAELLRLGAIEVVPGGGLAMIRRTLIPPEIDSRLESAILYSLCGLLETIAHNIDPRYGDVEPHFERFVESCPIPVTEIPRLRRLVSERLTAVSEELDSSLNELGSDDPGLECKRVGVGLFYTE